MISKHDSLDLDKKGFCRKMDQLLQLPADSVKAEQELRGLKNWDSLTILGFIAMADTDYSSGLQPAEIVACKTVDDLAQLTFAHSALNAA
jgi:acyl carrier protein